ncbi:MAG: adenylate kinase [Oscillospiraceae bacterium]|jgi:adenylate kinase|nr:adenylate kinase [Oscillospiraceae bacterium]
MKIVFLGPPGAGKGTQAQRVSVVLGIPQISTGDILRRAMREETTTGLEAKAYVDKGHLVPDELMIQIVRERLTQPDCLDGYILDGFPRTVPQAEALEKVASLDAVVNINIHDEALVARLSGRRVCLDCGATYHINHLGGKTVCDACGADLILREDDRPETVQNRLNVYHAQTKPLVDYYTTRGLVHTVAGDQPPDACFAAILETLGARR